MGLFGALDEETLPISKLIMGARVFEIGEPAVRMAANRFVNDGVLTLVERGCYGIGKQGIPLYQASRAWQHFEQRLVDWSGEWVCVHVSHLGRTDRKALRSRRRAFTLRGFAELEYGLWVRPSNLRLSTAEIADELKTLGLEERAIVIHASELIQRHTEAMHNVWDRKSLEASYHSALSAIEKSEATLNSKSLEAAAREVHEIGSCVVSVLTHDPLLPESFVDAELRHAVYHAMLSYNELGKSIWAQLFNDAEEKVQASNPRTARSSNSR